MASTSKSNPQMTNVRSLVKNNLKRPNIQVDRLSQALSQAQQSKGHALGPIGKGSSAALSILPDRPLNGNNLIDKSKSVNTLNNQQLTSARTNAPYVRPTDMRKTTSATVLDQFKKAVNTQPKIQARASPQQQLVRPQVGVKKPPFSAANVKSTILKTNADYIRRVQQRQGIVQPPQRIVPQPQRTSQQPQKPSNVQHMSGIFKKTSIDPAIQKQLEKNQTSMTEATRPLQIAPGVGKNTENSVSIIALKPNSSPASQSRVQNKPQNAEIAITPLMTPPGQAKKSAVQTISPKVTTINRPVGTSTSGTKVVISPQYLQGIKRAINVSFTFLFIF
jgi:hypothetical protein